MKKRVFPFLLAICCLFSLCALGASAVESRASTTLANYPVTIAKGSRSGEIKISYDVQANGRADSVGVSSIKIYESDGTYVTTITGSTGNGLIGTGVSRHRSSYIYSGTSGVSYYAKVTVFATIGSDHDSKTVTTGTAKAP